MKAKKTQMEQTTITSIILADDNTPFGDRTKNKGKDITRLLLQNPNGLDLGQDGLTLSTVASNTIYILCRPETNTNCKNQRICTTFNNNIIKNGKDHQHISPNRQYSGHHHINLMKPYHLSSDITTQNN